MGCAPFLFNGGFSAYNGDNLEVFGKIQDSVTAQVGWTDPARAHPLISCLVPFPAGADTAHRLGRARLIRDGMLTKNFERRRAQQKYRHGQAASIRIGIVVKPAQDPDVLNREEALAT
jgi:hypothetical protein